MTLVSDLRADQTSEEIRFELNISNTGPETVELQFTSGQKVEFRIYKTDQEIWRWGDGRMFTQALEGESIDPGEEVSFTGTWDDPAPGQYTVEAELAARNVELSERTELTI